MQVEITVNGERCAAEVDLETTLVEFLRDRAGLTGTHVGCSYEGRCGACTVLLDGHAVKSCLVLAVQVGAAAVRTVEGLAPRGELHPLQANFHAHHALQCGFCTPGMLMTAHDLIEHAEEPPTRDSIRRGLVGNLCRCTGYQHIVDAVHAASAQMRAAGAAARADRNGGEVR